MDFEKTVPEWNAAGTEPPASLKNTGFEPGYKPPAAFFNWFWHGVSACLTELRAKLSGHAAATSNPHGVTAAQTGAATQDLSNVTNAALLSKAASAGVGIPIAAAASTDGAAYTATVPGVTALKNGLTIIAVPAVVSTTNEITLNVNGLGAKGVRVPLSSNTSLMTSPRSSAFFTAGRTVTLQYDAEGGVWKTIDKQRASAQDLYGEVPIANGGTGATTVEGALQALGIPEGNVATPGVRCIYAGTEELVSGTSALPTGYIYIQYE
nr:MAG TPA: hypothetical protein [Caudoviricetes sp.]